MTFLSLRPCVGGGKDELARVTTYKGRLMAAVIVFLRHTELESAGTVRTIRSADSSDRLGMDRQRQSSPPLETTQSRPTKWFRSLLGAGYLTKLRRLESGIYRKSRYYVRLSSGDTANPAK